MKVLLYFEGQNAIKKSGIGRALKHQIKALESAGISYTLNPEDDFDILHINTYFLNSEFIIKKCRKNNIPIIYHAHSTEEDFKNSFVFSNQISPLYKRYLVNLYSKADEIITPTIYAKNILKSYNINLPIHPISNGIDLQRYQYDEEKIKAFYKYFNLSSCDKIIVGVGLLFERKGLIDFIEVAKQMPEYHFIWFGSSPSISQTKKVKDAINNCSCNLIMPGYVKGPIIEGAYLACDCFFFPSYEETEGIVVLEALASKQVVLVRDIDVYKPWLKHQENVLMASDNQGFIEMINYALNNDLTKLKDAGYLVAKERCIKNIGFKLKEVYLNLYNKKRNEKIK